MKILRASQSVPHPVAATIGNFDGVHVGHQTILRELITAAKARNLPSMLIIFEPSPQEYFMGVNAPARLTRLREKLTALSLTLTLSRQRERGHEKGLDYVMILRFDARLANMSAEQFVTDILQKKLRIQYLLVGDDFHFGKNRLGDFALLQSMASENFVVAQAATQRLHEERISSTRVRLALENGEMKLVEHLLGYPYSMLGKIIKGQQRGRTIGFPTANVALKRHRSPLLGVYAVKVYGLGDTPILGVANIGNRPTVDGTRSLLEVYLFDFDQDVYGKSIRVEFCHKIRDEKRFDSLDALKQQIADDVMSAKQYFAGK